MCFSATASFTTAAATALSGVVTVSYAKSWREIPLASMPLLFAFQQSVEGATWLELGHLIPHAQSTVLPNIFAYIALGIWPALSPVASLLVEPNRRRRIVIGSLLILAIPLALYGAFNTQLHPYNACVAGHSISYMNGSAYPLSLLAAYIVCTIGPLLLSSLRSLRIFGGILSLGFAASVAAFYAAFVSVWCFFAAAGSVVLLLHFRSALQNTTARLARAD